MQRVRNILADEQGISIVFAMILMVVLLIVGGIIVSYAYSGYQRAQQDRTDEQAYQTVYSAAKWVHRQFEQDKGSHTDNGDWVMQALLQASSSAKDTRMTHKLSIGNTTTDSGDAPQFDDITIGVTKVTEGSIDDRCSYDISVYKDKAGSDGNPEGSAWHFTVTYSRVKNNNDIGYHYVLSMGSSDSALQRMGQ